MTRRQLLHQIALILGGAISHPVVAAALSEHRPAAGPENWQPRTLTVDQDRLVTAIAELILPATHTPGATAAKVNEFIDLLLTDWFDADERERFLTGLVDLEASSSGQLGRPFLELDETEQLSLLEPLDAAAVEARVAAARAAGSWQRALDLPFFGMMKEMTLVGFYTSKVGLEQELDYKGYTGFYTGCVPLPENG